MIPSTAESPATIVLKARVAEQITYRMRADYPSADPIQFQREQLSRNGFARCEGSDNRWRSYLDSSGVRRVLIHRLSDYWINRNLNLFAILTASYISERPAPGPPDNSQQEILLRIQKSDDANAELAKLSIACSLSDKGLANAR
jgi:hypothetical protein